LDTTFGNVLDDLYFRLEGEVDAYTYLVQWVLKDASTGRRLILREAGYDVPAKMLLPPDREIVAERLEQPYDGRQSNSVQQLLNQYLADQIKEGE
jgi:hypothetical protein